MNAPANSTSSSPLVSGAAAAREQARDRRTGRFGHVERTEPEVVLGDELSGGAAAGLSRVREWALDAPARTVREGAKEVVLDVKGTKVRRAKAAYTVYAASRVAAGGMVAKSMCGAFSMPMVAALVNGGVSANAAVATGVALMVVPACAVARREFDKAAHPVRESRLFAERWDAFRAAFARERGAGRRKGRFEAFGAGRRAFAARAWQQQENRKQARRSTPRGARSAGVLEKVDAVGGPVSRVARAVSVSRPVWTVFSKMS